MTQENVEHFFYSTALRQAPRAMLIDVRATVALTAFLLGVTAAAVCEHPPWLDVPFVRQVKAGCGSAAVAMVMQYWVGQSHSVAPELADAARIHEILRPHSKKGIPGDAIRRHLEQSGFSAFVFDGEMRDLEEHTSKGRPVLVCIAPSGARGPLHYAVAVGVTEDWVYLNDPARGKLTREKRDVFERSWKLTRNWALLAVPRRAQAG